MNSSEEGCEAGEGEGEGEGGRGRRRGREKTQSEMWRGSVMGVDAD